MFLTAQPNPGLSQTKNTKTGVPFKNGSAESAKNQLAAFTQPGPEPQVSIDDIRAVLNTHILVVTDSVSVTGVSTLVR